jgi:hypothetical protein
MKGIKMKTIKVIFFLGAFAAVICVLSFFFLNKMFGIEEEKGTASLSAEIPFLENISSLFPLRERFNMLFVSKCPLMWFLGPEK